MYERTADWSVSVRADCWLDDPSPYWPLIGCLLLTYEDSADWTINVWTDCWLVGKYLNRLLIGRDSVWADYWLVVSLTWLTRDWLFLACEDIADWAMNVWTDCWFVG